MKTTEVIFNVKIKVNVPCGKSEAVQSYIEDMGEHIIQDALEQDDCEIQDCEILDIKVSEWFSIGVKKRSYQVVNIIIWKNKMSKMQYNICTTCGANNGRAGIWFPKTEAHIMNAQIVILQGRVGRYL